MAITVLSIPITDDRGKTQRMHVNFDDSVTLAQVTAFSDAFLADLDAAIGGVIGDPTVTFEIAVPGGLNNTPTADHWTTRGALMSFVADSTRYRHSVYVPTLLNALITAGQIETADPLFTAVRDFYLAGDAIILPTDRYGNDLIALDNATFRTHTK